MNPPGGVCITSRSSRQKLRKRLLVLVNDAKRRCVGDSQTENTFCAFFAIVRMREYISLRSISLTTDRKCKEQRLKLLSRAAWCWCECYYFNIILMGKRAATWKPGPDRRPARWCEMLRGGKEERKKLLHERFSFFSLVRKRFIRKRVFCFDSQGEGS